MPALNPQQVDAVRHTDSPLLVLAGAGSGKTRVITEKIAWLIDRLGLPAGSICAVTFTNKAAREMRERVRRRLKADATNGLRVSTFHTLGLQILQQEHQRAGYRRRFSIVDAQDGLELVQRLRHEAGELCGEAETARWAISRWKNDLVDPEQALVQAADAQTLAQARLYLAYERQLRACNAVDFDDLIALPVRLFREHRDTLAAWRERIRHLLVDEYQDTNACQYELIRLLVGPRPGLTVVGDDDQSIYAWRGARPENLARLSEDFPSLRVIKLEQNYRSTGRILRSANHLIANNPHLFDKRLWSELGPGDRLRILCCEDGEDEGRRVTTEILQHQFRSGSRFGDYAILYRGNHQSRPFEKALREHGVPYRISGGQSFFERSEIKDMMAYLRLLSNLDDDVAFLRIANTPRREIGAATLERLGQYARERNVGLVTASFEAGLATRLGPRQLASLERFVRLLVDLSDRAERGDPLAAVQDLIGVIGYEAWLLEISRDPKTAQRRMENVKELLSWMQAIAEKAGPSADFAQLVGQMSLMGMLDRDDEQPARDMVQLMTLHAAKGLEFPHVYMVAMEEDSLPHRTSIEQDNIEEERRLAYVGVTRARQSLTLSYASQRLRYGEHLACERSRFLGELPVEDVEDEGHGTAVDPETRRERGRDSLAALKGMLSSG
jgi:ATP-dependent DNA helicase Rep